MSDMGRLIIAMGMGTSTARESYLEAAQNAVRQALQHSSWTVIEAMGLKPEEISIKVSIGVQDPAALLANELDLPFEAEVHIAEGGLDVAPRGAGVRQIVASAAVEVFLPKQNGWRLQS